MKLITCLTYSLSTYKTYYDMWSSYWLKDSRKKADMNPEHITLLINDII